MGYFKRSSTTVSVLLILPSEKIDGRDGFWILPAAEADFQQALLQFQAESKEENTWRMQLTAAPVVRYNEKIFPRFCFA